MATPRLQVKQWLVPAHAGSSFRDAAWTASDASLAVLQSTLLPTGAVGVSVRHASVLAAYPAAYVTVDSASQGADVDVDATVAARVLGRALSATEARHVGQGAFPGAMFATCARACSFTQPNVRGAFGSAAGSDDEITRHVQVPVVTGPRRPLHREA